MKKDDFDNLVESVRQAGRIRRGEVTEWDCRRADGSNGDRCFRMTIETIETGDRIMTSTDTDVHERGERFYQEQLRKDLERTHLNSFVAIEPDSGDFFLGRTLSEASAAANCAHPDRRCCVVRVGHPVTLHIGAGL